MTRLQQIEEEIEKLAPSELTKLRDWIEEREWQQWDEQIERDDAAGKLDKLFAKGLTEHRAGKSQKL